MRTTRPASMFRAVVSAIGISLILAACGGGGGGGGGAGFLPILPTTPPASDGNNRPPTTRRTARPTTRRPRPCSRSSRVPTCRARSACLAHQPAHARRHRHQRHARGRGRRGQHARRLLPRARHHPAGGPRFAGHQLRGEPAREVEPEDHPLRRRRLRRRAHRRHRGHPLRPRRQARAAGAGLRHLRRRLGPPVGQHHRRQVRGQRRAAGQLRRPLAQEDARRGAGAGARALRHGAQARLLSRHLDRRARRAELHPALAAGLRRRDRQRTRAQLHRHAPVERGRGPRPVPQRWRGLDERDQDAAGAEDRDERLRQARRRSRQPHQQRGELPPAEHADPGLAALPRRHGHGQHLPVGRAARHRARHREPAGLHDLLAGQRREARGRLQHPRRHAGGRPVHHARPRHARRAGQPGRPRWTPTCTSPATSG